MSYYIIANKTKTNSKEKKLHRIQCKGGPLVLSNIAVLDWTEMPIGRKEDRKGFKTQLKIR